ncbi:hypothetical protein Phum_PHUM375960 [Pediculus humanus corporis]|uniref:Uncharacterized protein n=1 Tax=Pediculus humanus subsp. corporis TaxID=121224 RepID=E0VQC3_PEDHC|nr:uncharacterized protein Phum_PHUM375960 [Pediculus humanus corporis]EEB15579.1 hypothetical protein Phum_PHUM375960 [Pediculus humanus corporis]
MNQLMSRSLAEYSQNPKINKNLMDIYYLARNTDETNFEYPDTKEYSAIRANDVITDKKKSKEKNYILNFGHLLANAAAANDDSNDDYDNNNNNNNKPIIRMEYDNLKKKIDSNLGYIMKRSGNEKILSNENKKEFITIFDCLPDDLLISPYQDVIRPCDLPIQIMDKKNPIDKRFLGYFFFFFFFNNNKKKLSSY